jgi:hypothetical protein
MRVLHYRIVVKYSDKKVSYFANSSSNPKKNQLLLDPKCSSVSLTAKFLLHGNNITAIIRS